MTVKAKMIILIISVFIAIVLIYQLLYSSINGFSAIKDAEKQIVLLEKTLFELLEHEKRFIMDPSLQIAEQFQETTSNFYQYIEELKKLLATQNIMDESIEDVISELKNYENHFIEMTKLQQQIGFNEKEGLRGALRSAVHEAETRIKALSNYRALADILQLRRNEKDFLIRKDIKYQTEFEKNFNKTLTDLKASIYDPQQLDAINQSMYVYRDNFLTLVSSYATIGLSSDQGVQGKINRSVTTLKEKLVAEVKNLNQTLFKQTEKIIFIAVLEGLFIITVISILIYVVARSIIIPLNRLRQLISTASAEKNLTLRFQATTQDEIAEIGYEFNRMMETFGLLLNEVNKASLQLSIAAEEMSAIAKNTADGLKQQQQEIHHVSSAIENMKEAMQQISSNTESTETAAQTSQKSATESQKIITKAIDNIHEIAKEADTTAQSIYQLSENSAKIGTVLDVIKGIAEQTNLLALNASVEAARAGDQGRGFAVVADEVRALAKRTGDSATEIESMIIALQQLTEQVAVMMKASMTRSQQSAQEASGTIESLNEIVNGTNCIVEMTAQVARAIDEQTNTVGSINNNTKQIRDIVETSNNQVHENTQASEEVAKLANHLQNLVKRFKV